MRQINSIGLNAITNDGSTPKYSAAIDSGQMVYISAAATFSDNAAAGAFRLECSNDLSTANNLAVDQTPTTWIIVPNTSQTVVAGAAVLIPNTQISYRWVRLAWIPTAGAGTITGKFFGFTF